MEQVTAPTDQVIEVTDAGRKAMEAGYTGEQPVEPVAAEPKAAEPKTEEPKPAAVVAPEPAPAATTPELLDRKAVHNLIDGRLRDFTGNALKKALDERLKDFTPTTVAAATAAVKADGAAAPTQAQIKEATQSSAKMKQLEQDFPEFAAAMQEQAATLEQSILAKVPKAEKVDTTGFAPKDALAAVKQEFIDYAVDQRDPEWETKINTPEFAAWYSKLSPADKALGQSDSLKDGFKFMDLYAAHEKTLGSVKNTQSQDNKQRLKEAVVPATKGGKIAPKVMSPESAMEMGYKIASGQPV